MASQCTGPGGYGGPVPGKLIVAAAMFLGRVGPFTIALAAGDSVSSHQRYRLAREELPVG